VSILAARRALLYFDEKGKGNGQSTPGSALLRTGRAPGVEAGEEVTYPLDPPERRVTQRTMDVAPELG